MFNLENLIKKTIENARIEYVKFTEAHPDIELSDDGISAIIHRSIPNLRTGNIYDLMPILDEHPEVFDISLNEYSSLNCGISKDDKLDYIILTAVENLILMKIEGDPLILLCEVNANK